MQIHDELEILFQALGDKTRLRLLSLLSGGEMSVGELVERLGESQPKVSRHLAYLRGAGVVSTRRDGKAIYYFLDVAGAAFDILEAVLAAMASTKASPRAGTLVRQSTKARAANISAQPDVSGPIDPELEVFLL